MNASLVSRMPVSPNGPPSHRLAPVGFYARREPVHQAWARVCNPWARVCNLGNPVSPNGPPSHRLAPVGFYGVCGCSRLPSCGCGDGPATHPSAACSSSRAMSVIRASQSFVESRDWMNSAQIGKASGVSRGV